MINTSNYTNYIGWRFGTRLRSVVSDRPKVLAELHGKPFITLILTQLQKKVLDVLFYLLVI